MKDTRITNKREESEAGNVYAIIGGVTWYYVSADYALEVE